MVLLCPVPVQLPQDIVFRGREGGQDNSVNVTDCLTDKPLQPPTTSTSTNKKPMEVVCHSCLQGLQETGLAEGPGQASEIEQFADLLQSHATQRHSKGPQYVI